MRKRRILMTNEFSQLSAGYSVYGKELLGRLHASGDYEVAELACNAAEGDPRLAKSPWRVYPNVPSDRAKAAEFNSHPHNQFGQYAFNRVALDFRPDVVLDIRDPWMYSFIEWSPFRRMFHWIQMPTVDSAPYQEKWIATLATCDRVLTYTDWSRGVLEEEGGGLIDVFGVAPSGADFDNFQAYDQKAMRRKFNMRDDVYIVGTVMRNQTRKLYPQLIADFATFLRQADPSTAKKTFLYLHTAYPDQGWDIPTLIKQSGISHKILMTYKCRDCMAVFPSFYADASQFCPTCGGRRCTPPNVALGVDHATLGKIMSTFDVYVQYSNCEGLGMPQVEAAAAGVPIMSVDYSAMEDVVRKLKGRPIKVDSLNMEPDLGSYRARPDGRDFVKALKQFFRLGEREMAKKRREAREAVEAHYTWDKAVDVWRRAIESLPVRDWSETWDRPSLLHRPGPMNPSPMTHSERVRWAIRDVLGRPDLLDSYFARSLVRDLHWGTRFGDKDDAHRRMVDELTNLCNTYNEADALRLNTPFKGQA